VSAAPFDSLAEAFLEDKFEIIEGKMIFETGEHWDYGYGGETFSRNVFTVTVTGTYIKDPDGAGCYEIFEDSDAVRFLDEMFAWRGTA
jgi:hypothetical protein